MRNVKPKKSLGQHFLNDKNIAVKIVDSMSYKGYNNLLEIGPWFNNAKIVKNKTNRG